MPTLKFTPPKIKSVQSVRFGRNGAYADPKCTAYKEAIQMQAIEQLDMFSTIEGAVKIVRFELYFQRPKSHYSASGNLKISAPEHCMKTPDYMDNGFKGIGDALNGIAWVDDRQICYSGGGGKFWTDEPDHIILTFEEA